MSNLKMFELNVAEKQEFNPWPHSPTAKAKKLVGHDKRVLDVGCAKGYMAKELKGQNCKTYGIEIDPDASRIAEKYCQRVIKADIESLRELPFDHNFFDVILCLDILEHLKRPDLVFPNLRPYLSSAGYLIVSIPNIARFEHRLRLFFGKFDYGDMGALSKGHLRFFTLKTASELIESSGYKIEKIEPTGLGSIIRLFPNLLAFQFLFVAKKK